MRSERDDGTEGKRSLPDGLRALAADAWKPSAEFTERAVARALESQRRCATEEGTTRQMSRRMKLTLATTGVFAVALLVLGGTGGLASVVEAGRRWFNIGGDSAADVYVDETAPGKVVRVEAIYDGATGEATVTRHEEEGVGDFLSSGLQELEDAVASGELTVTRGTRETEQGVFDEFLFSDASGSQVGMVLADPDTGQVTSVSREKQVIRTSDDGEPLPAAEIPPGGKSMTFHVATDDQGNVRVTTDGPE